MAETVFVKARARSYPVVVGEGLDFGRLALEAKGAPCRAALVSDSNVFPLHGRAALESLTRSGFEASAYVFEAGEAAKSMEGLSLLLGFLASERLSRSDAVFALGGGVAGDLAGFAAAAYLRGIGFFQLPTTILAAVDSSVGGKTGVDLPAGKNMAGAFHPPLGVFCDAALFATLPKAVRADGMAEAVKHGMIADAGLLRGLSSMPDAQMCLRNVRIKAGIVERDEFESGARMLLNFGHTVGHAVEALSGYRVPHGSAVAIGMAAMTRACEKAGIADPSCLPALMEALDGLGLPAACPYSAREIAAAALSDKKRSGGEMTIVAPREPGRAELVRLPAERLEGFLAPGLEG